MIQFLNQQHLPITKMDIQHFIKKKEINLWNQLFCQNGTKLGRILKSKSKIKLHNNLYSYQNLHQYYKI